MPDTTCILDNGDWSDAGTWDNGVPGVSDRAIIAANDTVPAAPVGATTIHDIYYHGKDELDASANLTISHTIEVVTGVLRIKAQTTSGQAITISSGCALRVANNIAGNVTCAETDAQVAATNFNGTLTVKSADSVISGIIHALVIGNGDSALAPSNYINLVFSTGATIHFAQGEEAAIFGGVTAGPVTFSTVTADADLLMIANTCDITVTTTITADGSVTLAGGDHGFSVNGANIVGPATAGAVYKGYGLSNSPASVTGFEPLFKVGSGSVQSAYGASGVIQVPAASGMLAGTSAGNPDSPVDGIIEMPGVEHVEKDFEYGPGAVLVGTYDGSARWTDPGQGNVRLGTAYKANSTTNNKTGTLSVEGGGGGVLSAV